MIDGATFSPCRRYRYQLIRRWGHRETFPICMLNGSTANATDNDPTITRVINFAKLEGCDAIDVRNAHAYAATESKELKLVADPYGPDNIQWLERMAEEYDWIVVAWGALAKFPDPKHAIRVLEILISHGSDLYCLGTNNDGSPKHPLYLPAHIRVKPYAWEFALRGTVK